MPNRALNLAPIATLTGMLYVYAQSVFGIEVPYPDDSRENFQSSMEGGNALNLLLRLPQRHLPLLWPKNAKVRYCCLARCTERQSAHRYRGQSFIPTDTTKSRETPCDF